MITIHKNLWYVRRGNEDLAYMTYYEENKAFESRRETGLSWARAKEGITIPNDPIKGHVISESVSRWSTSNKLFRVIDPRGFVVEVPTGNISTLLKYTTVINGTIQEDCVWGREGSNHILLPKGSEPYRLSTTQTEIMLHKVPTKNLPLKSIVKFHVEDTCEYVYLGRYKFTWEAVSKRYKSLTSGWSSWAYRREPDYDSEGVNPQLVEDTKWVDVFVPLKEGTYHSTEVKNSCKVINTGKVAKKDFTIGKKGIYCPERVRNLFTNNDDTWLDVSLHSCKIKPIK